MAEYQQRIFRKSVMPKISVIVPVYKAEQYIRRCVDSILAQTFTDFELLLIDDGSPDNSGAICDEYAAKDSRIKVFHKENGGVSSARNLGLDNVTGEYISFIDADDYINPNLYLECSKYISDCDIIKFGISLQRKSSIKNIIEAPKDIREAQLNIICPNYFISVWSCIFRTSLIKNSNIKFDTRFCNSEDWLFVCSAVLKATTIGFSKYVGYNYIIGQANSISTKIDLATIFQSYQAFEEIKNIVHKYKD